MEESLAARLNNMPDAHEALDLLFRAHAYTV